MHPKSPTDQPGGASLPNPSLPRRWVPKEEFLEFLRGAEPDPDFFIEIAELSELLVPYPTDDPER
jgi:hypothetical protein